MSPYHARDTPTRASDDAIVNFIPLTQSTRWLALDRAASSRTVVQGAALGPN